MQGHCLSHSIHAEFIGMSINSVNEYLLERQTPVMHAGYHQNIELRFLCNFASSDVRRNPKKLLFFGCSCSCGCPCP